MCWHNAVPSVLLRLSRSCVLQGVELLPYHLLGRNKWEALGLAYPLEGVQTPPLEDVLQVVEQLEGSGLNVICDAKRQAAAQHLQGPDAL